ncbi:MAG: enoyl-CoA hydratase [Marmoricola sp.]|nr:enoyl-CoA hydratase [Marmoricola sp.]
MTGDEQVGGPQDGVGSTAGLEVRVESGILWITFARPAAYNALTPAMVARATSELRAAVTRDDVRVVVVTGTGRAFCAGADLGGEAAHEKYDGGSVDGANLLVRAIVELDKPVICGLNGVAAGVGVSVALACDLVVATASASFSLAFTRIGLMPDGGATALVAASVGRARAMAMALTSERVGAREAHAAGLVTHVHDDADHAAALEALARSLAAGPPLAFAATKRAVNAATLGGLEAAFQRERAGQSLLLRTADAAEGMRAFAEKRTPDFHGS